MDEPIAKHDDGRLAALRRYEVLDTAREAAFDDIATLAAILCKAPISAINFIDDHRQWTKAAVGVETLTMPVDLSICAHTIRQKGVLTVSDISADARFTRLLGAVAEPPPRFYAGVALETAEGHSIGTLCVFDTKPRELTEDQNAILHMLARHTITELELRSARQAERRARLEAERLLARNDLLMREIDHRVKNSLQVAAGMLALQIRRMPDSAAAQALEQAQRRISSIAAVHEQLYRASDADCVDMREFLEGICSPLAANRPDNVGKLVVEVTSVMFDSKRAMKVGLLVSELVTNAFKHAYADGGRGDIQVTLTANDETSRLVVSDDGVGVPEGFGLDTSKGLGMRLIRSILEECGGVMRVDKGPGARFIVEMPASRLSPHEQ